MSLSLLSNEICVLCLCDVFDLPELNKGSDLSFPFFSARCSLLGASDRFLIELKFGFLTDRVSLIRLAEKPMMCSF